MFGGLSIDKGGGGNSATYVFFGPNWAVLLALCGITYDLQS